MRWKQDGAENAPLWNTSSENRRIARDSKIQNKIKKISKKLPPLPPNVIAAAAA